MYLTNQNSDDSLKLGWITKYNVVRFILALVLNFIGLKLKHAVEQKK